MKAGKSPMRITKSDRKGGWPTRMKKAGAGERAADSGPQ